MKMRMILTAVGAPGAPTIIKALRGDENIEIIGTDVRGDIVGKYMVDKFYQVPMGTTDRFIETMKKIVMKEGITVIIPLATFELNNLARHKEYFERELDCKICVSDYESLEIVNNKLRLYEMFSDFDFIPKFFVPASIEEFERAVYELGYPEEYVCVKTPVGHGSRGFRIIRSDIDEWESFASEKPNNVFIDLEKMVNILSRLENFPEIFVSEYLPGEEWGIDSLINPYTHKFVSVLIRKNSKLNLSIPTACTTAENEEIRKIAEFIASKFKLSYSTNFDFKYTKDNIPKLLEINPRLSASCALAVRSGVNLPLLSVYLALNKDIDVKCTSNRISAYFYRDVVFVDELEKLSYL